MQTLTYLPSFLYIVLALILGQSLATSGLIQGRAVGGLDITILGKRILLRTYQVRPTKLYFQAAILQAA